jgi:hypothetical protein
MVYTHWSEKPKRKPPRYYKLRTVASLLPDRWLRWIGRRWKLDYDPSDGWTFWLDASYVKYCRVEERRAKRSRYC